MNYIANAEKEKFIQHPYGEYSGHFCLGIIYSRKALGKDEELKTYTVNEVEAIPAVIENFLFFAEEKWKIASDKGGSGILRISAVFKTYRIFWRGMGFSLRLAKNCLMIIGQILVKLKSLLKMENARNFHHLVNILRIEDCPQN